MQNELFLLLSFGLILLLSEILIVFFERFLGRLLKKVCFCTGITDFKGGNFLSECKFAVKANVFAYKIFFIDFHLVLDDD